MNKHLTIPDEIIINKIYLIRGKKVMIDKDLAELYGVETGQLKRQVRRNIDRFPDDFMFELIPSEYDSLRSQTGILNRGQHTKYLPMAFTEQGVAMLSSVLHSRQAIEVNIRIMRIFTHMREILLTHKDILLKLEQLEKKLTQHETKMVKYDQDIQLIFAYLKKLINPSQPPRRRIGYKLKNED